MQAQADLLQRAGGHLPVRRTRPRWAWPRWRGSAPATRPPAGEAVGTAEVEAIVEPSITADQAAERISVFRSALDLTLARR